MDARQLLEGVEAVAAHLVGVGGLEHADVVVVVQGFDGHLGEAGELADLEHRHVVTSFPIDIEDVFTREYGASGYRRVKGSHGKRGCNLPETALVLHQSLSYGSGRSGKGALFASGSTRSASLPPSGWT